jgi:hypothetical protein
MTDPPAAPALELLAMDTGVVVALEVLEVLAVVIVDYPT